MLVKYHRRFVKNSGKLPTKIQTALYRRLEIFMKNQFDPILNNHRLGGEYQGYRSINITGDYRAIFTESKGQVTFFDIGTHHELYGK